MTELKSLIVQDPQMSDYFYRADEYGKDPEDCCSYQDEVGVLTSYFGWCGCGDPDAALMRIVTFLKLLRERSDANTGSSHTEVMERVLKTLRGEAVQKDGWDIWNEHMKNFCADTERQLMLYVLDAAGMTEHGSSISGSWPTDLGRRMIADVERLFGEIDLSAQAKAESE